MCETCKWKTHCDAACPMAPDPCKHEPGTPSPSPVCQQCEFGRPVPEEVVNFMGQFFVIRHTCQFPTPATRFTAQAQV